MMPQPSISYNLTETFVPGRDAEFNALLAEVRDICKRTAMPANFFTDIANLPASLVLVKQRLYQCPASETALLRQKFNNSAKPAFIQHLGENFAVNLSEMGITPNQIDRMRKFGFFPKTITGERLDCSIDHIRSLKYWGTNDFFNFTFIPSKLNALKNLLENIQHSPEEYVREIREIITIVPVKENGEYLRVPFIPGGFKPRGPQQP